MDSTLQRVLKIGLLSLFVLVPLAVFPWSFYTTQVKSVVLVGCVALTAMGWLWIAIVEDRHEVGLTFTNGVLLFNMLVWILTLATSPYINEGLPVISKRLAGIGFLLLAPALLGRRRDLKLGLILLFSSAALMSVIGLLQFFHLDPFVGADKVGHFRVASTAHHPNIFVTFLVACVPLNIAAFRLFEPSTRNRVLLGLSLVLSLAAAAATLSRAGMGAMVVAVPVAVIGLWATGRKGGGKGSDPAARKRTLIMLAVPVGLAVLIMVGMVVALTRGMLDPGEQARLLDLKGSTTQKRVLIYQAALKMAAEDPLLGRGLGTFPMHLPAYRTAELASQFPRNEYHAEAAVSEPLEVQVESGAVGLLAWLMLVGLFVIRPLRAMTRLEDPGLQALVVASAAAMLGMVAHGLVEVSLRFLPPLFMFWAVPGLALAAERVAGEEEQPSRTLDLSSWPLRLSLSVVVGMTFGLIFAVTLSDWVANIFVDRGERAYKRGQVEQAERAFRSAEATWTGNLPGRYRRAAALWKLGHLARAEKAYREVVELSPYYFDVNHNLARVLFEQGKLKQAEQWTRKATRLNPYHIPSHELAVRLALKQGRMAEADRVAQHMLKAAGDYTKAPNTARFVWSRVAMARVRQAQGRKADARRLLDQALAADPRNKEARHLRGTLQQ